MAQRRSILPPLIAATVASLLFTAVFVERVNWEGVTRAELDRQPDAAQITPFQLEEKVATRRKMGAVAGYAAALFGAPVSAFLVAVALWIAFRVAGAAPAFLATLAVSAWAMVPSALGRLLTIPAVARAEELVPEVVTQLVPWNGSFFLPMGAKGPAFAAAASVDLFGFWSLALLAAGMASVAGTSRRRAAVVVILLWCALVAVGMAAAGSAPSPT
jgi:hypothetical protein